MELRPKRKTERERVERTKRKYMEGRRISARCCGRRIVASKGGRGFTNGSVNHNSIVKKLQSREICSKPHRAFATATAHQRFSTMRLVQEYDTHDPKPTHYSSSSPSLVLPFLMKRSKLVEIVAAKNLVFALAHSGLCAAFSRGEDCAPLVEE